MESDGSRARFAELLEFLSNQDPERFGSIRKFAAHFGEPHNNVRRYLNGERKSLPESLRLALSRQEAVNLEWLDYGRGTMFIKSASVLNIDTTRSPDLRTKRILLAMLDMSEEDLEFIRRIEQLCEKMGKNKQQILSLLESNPDLVKSLQDADFQQAEIERLKNHLEEPE